jgi:hypothetical protein
LAPTPGGKASPDSHRRRAIDIRSEHALKVKLVPQACNLCQDRWSTHRIIEEVTYGRVGFFSRHRNLLAVAAMRSVTALNLLNTRLVNLAFGQVCRLLPATAIWGANGV